MNILNLSKWNTVDSEPLLLDDISEEERTIRSEALGDPHYFTKMFDSAMANPNTIMCASAVEDVEILIPPDTFEQDDNDR